MADDRLLGRKLRTTAIVSLATGMLLLCLLAFFFPSLQHMVPPEPSPSPSPVPSPSFGELCHPDFRALAR